MSCSCHSSSTHMLSTTAVAAAAAAPGCIRHNRWIGGMSQKQITVDQGQGSEWCSYALVGIEGTMLMIEWRAQEG